MRVIYLAPLLLLVPSVAHAQSAATPNAATPSSAGGEVRRVEVHLATAEPGVTVYSRPVSQARRNGEDGGELPAFKAICETPCDTELDPTLHEFALAPPGGEPLPATPAFELHQSTRLRGDIISHESERRTGWWILGILGAVGVTSTTIGMFQTCVDDQSCQEWTSLAIWSGIALTTAGALIGLPKITTSDEATLTLVPGTAPLTNPAGARLPGAEQASVIPGGATFVGHF